MNWKAVIQEGKPWDLAVRLHIFRRHADGRVDITMSNGWMQTIEEGTVPSEDAGLLIPREALEAVAEAFAEHIPARVARLEGEIKVLRETLARAEGRVELMVDKALEDR